MNNNSTQQGSRNLKKDTSCFINSTSGSKAILTDIHALLSLGNTGGFAVFINFLSTYLRLVAYKRPVQLKYCMLNNEHSIMHFIAQQKH